MRVFRFIRIPFLGTPMKRQYVRSDKKKKKKNARHGYMCCLKETHLKYEGRSLKRIEKMLHSANTNRKKIRVCVLISHNVNFRPMILLRMKMAMTR